MLLINYLHIFVRLFVFGNKDLVVHPDVPKGYFANPVKGEIKLSATFGELRPNHFHAGLDIRAQNGKEGDEILACAEGFVSRISIKGGGYGNCLYISHPNGYTTVYAHLEMFSKEIEEFALAYLKAEEVYEIDLTIPEKHLPIQKGQFIGYMGNTGHSYGKHLHFEIRETTTDKPMNPFLFGLQIPKDEIPPFIQEAKIYSWQKLRSNPSTAYLQPYLSYGSFYRIPGDTLTVNKPYFALGIKTYDKTSPSSNKDGIYSIDVHAGADSAHLFGFEMDAFSFEETKCINAHCDYHDIVSREGYFNRCFKLPNNTLKCYKKEDSGILHLSDSLTKVTVTVKDFEGNPAQLQFVVRYAPDSILSSLEPPKPEYNYLLLYDQNNQITTDKAEFFFPKGSLYDDLPMQYSIGYDRSPEVFSDVHRVHRSNVPINKNFKIKIVPNRPLDSLLQKSFIAYRTGKGYVSYGGEWVNNGLQAEVDKLGEYCIAVDTEVPSIRPLFSTTPSKSKRKKQRQLTNLRFKVQDNVSSVLKFKGYVDGNWVFMSYDKKSATLTYDIPEDFIEGEHFARLVVTDEKGNEAVWESEFVY